MSDSAAPFLVLALGAAALLYLTQSQAGETDVASFNTSDLLSGATGSILDMTTTNTAGDPNQNRQAFLDMVALSEIGSVQLASSQNGYDVVYGGGRFTDYSTHPDIWVPFNNGTGLGSTAAGRYQINFPTFQTLTRQTGLTDFSPATQDAMALQLAANKGALADIDAGNIQAAIAKCAPVWASFAGAGYGQRENSMSNLLAWYQNAGGAIA